MHQYKEHTLDLLECMTTLTILRYFKVDNLLDIKSRQSWY